MVVVPSRDLEVLFGIFTIGGESKDADGVVKR